MTERSKQRLLIGNGTVEDFIPEEEEEEELKTWNDSVN